MRATFLSNSHVVLNAISDARIADAWNTPSTLEDQTIGSLVGHLARGSVWVVNEYLNASAPTGPVDYESASAYFAEVANSLTAQDHEAIRNRGAEIAKMGHAGVINELTQRLNELSGILLNEPQERLLSVFAGRVMRLDDYLLTRLVEQVVHLDDLARSLAVDPWSYASGAAALVIECGADIGRIRSGELAMVRTLFRDGGACLPVL